MRTQPSQSLPWRCEYCERNVLANYAHKCSEYDSALRRAQSHEAATASSPEASIPNADRGPEMQRLVERLYGNPARRSLNFNAWWGPEAHKLTVEERAASINHMLDEIEGGRAALVNFDEDFEQAAASAIDARQRQDNEDWPDPKGESAVAKPDAQGEPR
jgi:hypothetical protein